MLEKTPMQHSWQESFASILHRKVVAMLFLGFSAGLPIMLIFSSLSLWLREAGVERSAVTYFSWAALGYSFKFVWAPLVDRLPLPFLTGALGLRRSWLLLSQISIFCAIALMASTDPALSPNHLTMMAIGAVLLGFSSATQDIVIDAYRIESAESELQGMMSATYIAGYRLGMIVAGAGALYLASYLGSIKGSYDYQAWRLTYQCIALLMVIGFLTTLIIKEPILTERDKDFPLWDYARLVIVFLLVVVAFVGCFFFSAGWVNEVKDFFNQAVLSNFLIESCRLLVAVAVAFFVTRVAVAIHIARQEVVDFTYVEPIRSFFNRYGYSIAWLLLALIGLYRISDIVLGVISNVFYYDMGYSKNEVASAVKLFGVVMAIVGGFLGGILTMRYGVMRILFIGALLVALTNLLFIILVYSGHDLRWLYFVVSVDNLVGGFASAAFIAFLSSLVDVRFTAMQYAIFSSLMTLLPKLMGGYSGGMVDSVGYTSFFLIVSAMGLPVLLLIYWTDKKIKVG